MIPHARVYQTPGKAAPEYSYNEPYQPDGGELGEGSSSGSGAHLPTNGGHAYGGQQSSSASASASAAAVAPLLYVQLTQAIGDVRSELRVTTAREEQSRQQLERQISALVEPLIELRQAVQHQQQRLREVELAARAPPAGGGGSNSSNAGGGGGAMDAQQVARAVWSVQNRVEADQRAMGEEVQTALRQLRTLARQNGELEQAMNAAASRAAQQIESAQDKVEARFRDKIAAQEAKSARLEAQLDQVTKALAQLGSFPGLGTVVSPAAASLRSPVRARASVGSVGSPSSSGAESGGGGGNGEITTALASLDAASRDLGEPSLSLPGSSSADSRMQQSLRAWLQAALFEREQARADTQMQLEARVGSVEAAAHATAKQLAQALADQQAAAEQAVAMRQQLQNAQRHTELNGEEMQRAFGGLKSNWAQNVKLLKNSVIQQQRVFHAGVENQQRDAMKATQVLSRHYRKPFTFF